ncbi:MAG TPA: carboxymuconolactone decarboxylase family protein [Parafilimonas sp.]|nr:carboxymuconolactone decarboxylase family protein [Parafilimonas sp.]
MIQLKYLLIVGFSLFCLNKNLNAQQPMNTNQALDSKLQSIVTISAFTANGNQEKLNESLNEGLNAGLTINEIKEVIIQLYAYAGFPRSLNALHTFMAVLKERKSKGINDEPGKEASPLSTGKSKLQFGTEMQTKLVGQPVKGEVYEFAPAIDSFLKEHLFGDIFGRDNLDWKTRELATISALASLGGTENQLRSHINVGMYNGVTEQQLNELVAIIQAKVDVQKGAAAKEVLQTVLKQTNTNATNEEAIDANLIFLKGDKASPDYFTGTAWVNRLVQQDETRTYSIGNVVFEPGAKTNWHIHPAGQILLVFDGKGWYQEKGKPARAITKGDVVVIPSNTEHWHGASKNSSLTHLAITNAKDGGVKWLQAVSEEEYNTVQ